MDTYNLSVYDVITGGTRITKLLNQKMSLFFLATHLNKWQMIIFMACSLSHIEICINIVFLSHVCAQQETKLGSGPEGWGEGE